ncbi:HAMP domain-containing protein [bacterium]|nr:HAMP domain-containing protein [bacterium]
MKSIASLSIKNKLIVLILSVTSISFLIGASLITYSSIWQFKKDMISETQLYADFIGESFISPLLFNDVPGGQKILSKLHKIPWIEAAVIYDANGKRFANYSKNNSEIPGPILNGKNLTKFINKELYVSKSIGYMEEKLGQILIISSRIELDKKINAQIFTMSTIIVFVLLISYYISLRLQKIISGPILFLADVTKKLSIDGDYSVRLVKSGDDEIGVLYDGFNDMLSQVQKREKEIKEAGEAIRTSEARLAEAQRIASIGSWEWNINNNSMVFSSEMYRLLDCEQKTTPSINLIVKRFYKRDKEKMLENIKMAQNEGREFECTCHHRINGGGIRLLSVRGEVIKNSEGNVEIVHGTAQDVTRQKAAENEIRKLNEELEERVAARTAELRAVNEELEQFAYVVSHDLKAPLRGVSQLSQWVVEDYENVLNTEGREHLHLMKQRIRRMYNLIDGILQYSRVGRVKERKQEIDLNLLVKNIIEAISPPSNITINVENILPVIYAEKTRIEQIFQNLISNAVKFNDKEEGLVTIFSEDVNTHWKFSISDNGPGIEKKYYERIYQIFQTLSPRDELESTGIGLTLVKKIVEIMGGKIWLESETGFGTTFYFTIDKKEVSMPQVEENV